MTHSLALAQYQRLARQCAINPPGLRIRLLRALAIARPEIRYEP
jgi:hypothetical protein